MPQPASTLLEPRKSPVQARSTASVAAILEATIQVLLQVGKERLTTTRVAQRAGVSIGTLYQYFPNKTALLKAALCRHMDEVVGAVERVCHEQRGKSLEQMATALIAAFLEAKMRDGKSSVALYAVSSDVDGATIAQQKGLKSHKAIVAMLKTASEWKPVPPTIDPHFIASVLQGVMSGISRRLLESPAPEKQFEPLRQEMTFLARAYLSACAVRSSSQAQL